MKEKKWNWKSIIEIIALFLFYCFYNLLNSGESLTTGANAKANVSVSKRIQYLQTYSTMPNININNFDEVSKVLTNIHSLYMANEEWYKRDLSVVVDSINANESIEEKAKKLSNVIKRYKTQFCQNEVCYVKFIRVYSEAENSGNQLIQSIANDFFGQWIWHSVFDSDAYEMAVNMLINAGEITESDYNPNNNSFNLYIS